MNKPTKKQLMDRVNELEIDIIKVLHLLPEDNYIRKKYKNYMHVNFILINTDEFYKKFVDRYGESNYDIPIKINSNEQ